VFDVAWAAIAPLLALYVRGAYVLESDEHFVTAAIYIGVAFAFSLLAFALFGLRDSMPRYFSVHDAIDVAKAVLVGELLTCAILFTFTRLEGIPRSTPVIHALILGAGLVAARALGRLSRRDGRTLARRHQPAGEHIIMVGITDLSSLYMKFIEAFSPGERRVIGLVDDDERAIGRSINGVPVLGPPAQLEALIEEFTVHGIQTDRIVVGGESGLLSESVLHELERICAKRDIALEFVPRLFNLDPQRQRAPAPEAAEEEQLVPAAAMDLPAYFQAKRLIDFVAALVIVTVLSPLWFLVAILAFLDVGSPVLFWQQRIGLNGSTFLLHKVRTLRAPFDWRGRRIPEPERLTWIGQLLRKTRLDEMPQLLNVLVGDMSLIGPRPLLPQDQPQRLELRLAVRPGITGWAQVNGGTKLTPTEKAELDEWYIRNASFLLDVRIAFMTAIALFRGDRRSERALALARAERDDKAGSEKRLNPA
jgi:lipopolysaccharide/colanic/teichoic acid biosynthesis glycosyltransferase